MMPTDSRMTCARLPVNVPGLVLIALSIPFILVSCQSSSPGKDKINNDSTYSLLAAPTPLSTETAENLRSAVSTWYETVLDRSAFNGGILVAKNGNIIYEKYKGVIHYRGNDTINAETPFHIASVSKTFTAMATLKLWEYGKLNIDDEYSKYFPSFNYPGITIRSLLSNRSGLPNYLYFMEDLGWDKSLFITNQDVYDWLVNRKAEIKNIAPPNTHFTYCNTNFALLALLIEKTSGISYPAFIDREFFKPLHMTHSYVYTPADSARATPSYDWRGHEIPMNFLDNVYGDKNIYTTPRDLLNWDRGLSGKKLFKDSTLIQAYTPYSNEKPGIKNYGLGWRMNVYPTGKKMIFHNGWWHGNNAVFIRLLDEDATIIVMNNRYTNAVYKAKNVVNAFNRYFDVDEDEETENFTPAATDSVTPLHPTVIRHRRKHRR
jgi:CubicO group peptidase (beta-lactamase class C family)